MKRLLTALMLVFGSASLARAQGEGALPGVLDVLPEPEFYHTGFKVRGDLVAAEPVHRDLRGLPFDLGPGFGFDLQIGYGISPRWSLYAGYVTVSHKNTDQTGRNPDQTFGSNGVTLTGLYRFNIRNRYQPFGSFTLGRYELVNGNGDGRTGWGTALGGGVERWITNRFSVGLEASYRLTIFPQAIVNGRGRSLDPNTRGDVLVVRLSAIRTLVGIR